MEGSDPVTALLARLSLREQSLWGRDQPDSAQEGVRGWVTGLESQQLSTWTVIDGDGESEFPMERLTAIHPVVAHRRFGDGMLLLCRDSEGPWVTAVAPAQQQGVMTLITGLSWSDARWQRFTRWVRWSARMERVFLNERDFIAIGDALAESGPIGTSRLTARNLVDGSSYTRGWPGRLDRARPTHRQVLVEARSMSIRTLTVHVGSVLYLQLRRDAGSTFYRGNFGLFETEVIERMAAAAATRRDLLVGRARPTSQLEPPRPLTVRADEGTFAEEDAIAELLATLERERETGVAVLHRNPYLHATVTDYSDGSTADVFVNDDREVVLIPGYRASPAALARVTGAIGERFAASEVTELPLPAPPTRDDLLYGLG